MIKGSFQQEDIAVAHIHASNIRTPKYTRQTSIEWNGFHSASWIYMFIILIKSEKISAIQSSNIYYVTPSFLGLPTHIRYTIWCYIRATKPLCMFFSLYSLYSSFYTFSGPALEFTGYTSAGCVSLLLASRKIFISDILYFSFLELPFLPFFYILYSSSHLCSCLP